MVEQNKFCVCFLIAFFLMFLNNNDWILSLKLLHNFGLAILLILFLVIVTAIILSFRSTSYSELEESETYPSDNKDMRV